MTRGAPIRNPALVKALDSALRGDERTLFDLLLRLSGLPGPSPSWAVADAVGRHLADLWPASEPVVARLCLPRLPHAALPSAAFLPICGAATLGRMAQAGRPDALSRLRDLADDARSEVRSGIARALGDLVCECGDAGVSLLDGWTHAYLPAAVLLETVVQRRVLDRLRSPTALVAWLDEAFDLAETAPRADQRSQGHRRLVQMLAQAGAAAAGRFPAEVHVLLQRRATARSPVLRRCIESALDGGRRDPGLEGVRRALSESAPARRDPRSYVGPTRRRGQKRRRGRQ